MNPEQARPGDWVRLKRNWQDCSGIPLFAIPAGEFLKVIYPDLTTGGVFVEHNSGATFSLKPDEYETGGLGHSFVVRDGWIFKRECTVPGT